MPTYTLEGAELNSLESEWTAVDADFQNFRDFRALEDGTWPMLAQGRLKPEVIPELKDHIQGAYTMFGELDDDLRIMTGIKSNNPTRYNVHAAGISEKSKKVESNWKLYWSSIWTQYINYGRWLDEYVYSGQNGLGLACFWRRWCAHKDEEGNVRGSPVEVVKVLAECIRFKGNYRNPSAAWIKYSVSAIDCDIKNSKGERPAYRQKGGLDLGWVSEPLPGDFYTNNSGQEIDVIVRDAEDPIAMCPLPGCYHKKRRICIYICKKGGAVKDFEKVEEYDSPFEKCSFRIVPGDLREHERDPHRIFRPEAWVLYSIIDAWNRDATTLDGLLRKQLSNDQLYADSTGTSAETIDALTSGAEGGNRNTIEKPEVGGSKIPVMPTVKILPQPSIEGLFRRLDMHEKRYNARVGYLRVQTGQMATSEVSATVGQLVTQGSGVPIGPGLAHWDIEQVTFIEEIRHAIRFTSYFEPDEEKTKYIAMVTGKEPVIGKRYADAGELIVIDAKMCEHDVAFFAETSKDTPSEARDRKLLALTGYEKRILTKSNLMEAWDVFDTETQEQALFREDVRAFMAPLIERRIGLLVAGKSASVTGMDLGEENLIAQTLPDIEEGGPQTYHNTQAANSTTMNPTPITTEAAGTPTGGSSGLA